MGDATNLDSANLGKWGIELLEPGFTVVPNALLANVRALQLSATELAVLLQLLMYWWQADRPPFPPVRLLCDSLHMTRRTVQRALAALDDKGLVQRERRETASGRRQSDRYHFTGLREKLKPYAASMAEDKRRRRAKARAAREREGLEGDVDSSRHDGVQ